MQKAQFFKKESAANVRCSLCEHRCLVRNNSTGVCGARKNIAGQLFSMVYGLPAAINPDPIEKKPFFHFQPGSLAYSFGTLGCNFRCLNCQNFSLSQSKDIERLALQLDFVEPEKLVESALESECKSIAYTYNEPTIFTEYALETMRLAHEYGLKNVWVSNGYMTDECLESVIPYLDAANIDLKSFEDAFYAVNCGAKLEPVLRNIKILKRSEVHLEITTLIIPDHSDDLSMLESIAQFIADELDFETPWHLSRFAPEISWKLKKAAQTGEDILYEAWELGKEAGLKYVYIGNVPGDQKENTYCPRCGELAIQRLGYQIERFDSSGRCSACDKNLDIIE
jgi:pyruvate formate lyase activating enzyme